MVGASAKKMSRQRRKAGRWGLETKNPLGLAAKRVKSGGQTRNRTEDTRIFSPLLYQLSYLALRGAANKGWRGGRVNGKFRRTKIRRLLGRVFAVEDDEVNRWRA